MIARYSSRLIALLLFTFSVCISGREARINFDVGVLATEGWPKLMTAASNLDAQGCPKIAGEYVAKGEEVVFVQEGAGTINRSRGDGESIFSFYVNRKWDVIDPKSSDDKKQSLAIGMFRISEAEAGRWVIHELLQKKEVFLLTREITLENKVHECVGGRIVHSRSGGGYSDGARSTYQMESFLTLLEDGSLLFFESSVSTSRSFFVFGGSRRVVTYSRYLPARKS